MLIYAIGVSVDGYIADRNGNFDWTPLSDALFQMHTERVGALAGYLLGRRLYEDMLVWETDPSMRDTPAGAAFADIWTALPKVVFSRTLESVRGNARLATGSLAEEIAAGVGTGDAQIEIGGADLASQAIALDLVDELRVFRSPVIVGGGTRHLPPLEHPLPLELVETRDFDSGVVSERYRRVGGRLGR